jgi:hypothetical protein
MKSNTLFYIFLVLFPILSATASYGEVAATTSDLPALHHARQGQGKGLGKFRESFKVLHAIKALKKQAKNDKLQGREGSPRVHGLAIAGFVLSILSLILPLIIGLGVVLLSILAIIFSAIAMSHIRRNPEKFSGFGFAVAGLVIGIVVLALILVLFSFSFIYG